MSFESHTINISNAVDKRLEQSQEGLLFMAQAQGNTEVVSARTEHELSMENKERISRLFGLSEATNVLRASLFDQASKNELADSSRFHMEEKINNQEYLVSSLMPDSGKLLETLADTVAKIHVLIESIQDKKGELYDNIREGALAWKNILDVTAHALGSSVAYDARISDVQLHLCSPRVKVQEKVAIDDRQRKSYKDRLGLLMEHPRVASLALTYLNPEKGMSLADAVMDEYIETAFVFSAVRVLDRIQKAVKNGKDSESKKNEQSIDIVSIRTRIQELQSTVVDLNQTSLSEAEKKESLEKMDEEMTRLLIPVANKVARIFPHKKSTTLNDILENEDAICAGKVNVLLVVAKFFGINARASSINHQLNGDAVHHVCAELDLLSGKKLCIDANFGKTSLERKQLTYTDAINQNPRFITDYDVVSKTRYNAFARENSEIIPIESNILIYSLEKTNETIDNYSVWLKNKENNHTAVRIDLYSGKQELWHSDIAHPHLVTLPDTDGHIHDNSSVLKNSSSIFESQQAHEISRHFLTKCVESISPYNGTAYDSLFEILTDEERLIFCNKVKVEKPNIYWEYLSMKHLDIFVCQNDYRKVDEIVREMKAMDEDMWYTNLQDIKNIHVRELLSRQKHSSWMSHEAGEDLDAGLQFMLESYEKNQALFCKYAKNVKDITTSLSLSGKIQSAIDIYKQCQKLQPDIFWHITPTRTKGSLATEMLEMIIRRCSSNNEYEDEVKNLLYEIKEQEPLFFIQNIYPYHLQDNMDVEERVSLIEDIIESTGNAIFFKDDANIVSLVHDYVALNRQNDAIDFLKKCEAENPRWFWNGSGLHAKSKPLYKNLEDIYNETHQNDKLRNLRQEAEILGV